MGAPYKPFDFSTSTIHTVDFTKLARDLREGDAFQKSGRVAVTVARGDRMTVVLTVLKRDTEIHGHEAPGPITLVVLSGSVALRREVGGGKEIRLDAGASAIFGPEVRHSLVGLADSAFVIAIGGR
jgi:quercetin dioxygenase-like cupin family protein